MIRHGIKVNSPFIPTTCFTTEPVLRSHMPDSSQQSLAPKTKEKTPAEPREKTPVDPNFWKSKIKLSAFECWHDGELENDVLATPPFPFKQGWDKEAQAEMAKLNEKKGRGGGGGGGLHKRSAWGSKWDGLMGGV